MQLKTKLAVTGAGLLALTGGGLGATLASSAPAAVRVIPISQTKPASPPADTAIVNSPTPAVNEPASAGTEADNVESGDQTTPDAPGATAGEKPGAETETAATSDGPGGHADGPGDVQHQGGASEQ